MPVDFSAGSKQALSYAFGLARAFNASIILVHVVEPVCCTMDYGYGDVAREWPNEQLVKLAEAKLTTLKRRLTLAGVPAQCSVRSGKAFAEIVAEATASKCGLIVIATKGLSFADEGIIGSTAERVARHATCPVLVVRRKEREFVRLPDCSRG